MNRCLHTLLTIAFVLSITAVPACASDVEDNLAAPLQSFGPLLGKTWKGAFKDSTPEKPLIDIARWERALNGQAIRVLHSLNNGVYGGETLITWDAKKNSLAYWYFTTAGFRTEGTMKHEGGRWTGHETVEGAAGGITEVKSTTELLPDGRLQVKTEYLKNGKWSEGRETTYELAPEAKVIFK
jgi:hypothetical protein